MAVAMERVYENQKIENILNLAMDATPAEREVLKQLPLWRRRLRSF